jgi:DNA-binding HxlR family transcriptional regulator
MKMAGWRVSVFRYRHGAIISWSVFMKIRSDYTCPLEVVHDFIRGKWKTIILFELRDGCATLSELERRISGISQKMLLEQLGELRDFGLVSKKTFEGYPLHVEYSLTEPMGRKILEAIRIMQDVGVAYMVEHGMTDILDQKGIDYRSRRL